MLSELVQNSVVSLHAIAVAVIIGVIIILFNYIQTKSGCPGPTGIPLLGYWPFLDRRNVNFQLGKLKEKYGDVYGINILGQLYINLGTVSAVREAHVTKGDCFTERSTKFSILTYLFSGSVAFVSGDRWRIMRKFFLNLFKERGMTSISSTLNGPLSDGMMGALDELKKANGKPINVVYLLQHHTRRILRDCLFGDTNVTVTEIEEISEIYEIIRVNLNPYNFLMAGNFAKYIVLPFTASLKCTMRNREKVLELLMRLINKQKQNMEENDSIISCFFKERDERKKKGDPTHKEFTEKALASSLLQFVGDGSLSASRFVSKFFKVLLEHPEEQEKIFQELQEVVGPGRQPCIEDKMRMPYTNAFLNEVLRTNDFFPFFPSLVCTKETTVGGCKVPKGAITLVNMWAAHNDGSTYENPEKFNPSRFLASEGRKRDELPITFGMGKRMCLGESFVMIQSFLFLTTLIKNYQLIKAFDSSKSALDLIQARELIFTARPRNM